MLGRVFTHTLPVVGVLSGELYTLVQGAIRGRPQGWEKDGRPVLSCMPSFFKVIFKPFEKELAAAALYLAGCL